ncbi:Glutamine-binding protein [Bienertia sinuspersici]
MAATGSGTIPVLLWVQQGPLFPNRAPQLGLIWAGLARVDPLIGLLWWVWVLLGLIWEFGLHPITASSSYFWVPSSTSSTSCSSASTGATMVGEGTNYLQKIGYPGGPDVGNELNSLHHQQDHQPSNSNDDSQGSG